VSFHPQVIISNRCSPSGFCDQRWTVKRFIGLIMALAGGCAALWGGFFIITGRNSARLEITPEFTPTALAVALTGVAVFTVGLIWSRD
jgi:hypothetical protein